MQNLTPFFLVLSVGSLACSTAERTPLPANDEAQAAQTDDDVFGDGDDDDDDDEEDVTVGPPRVCTQLDAREDDARVLLVVDRSGSMGEPFDTDVGGADKWAALRDALVNVTAALTDSVEHGLVLFPSRDGDICDGGTTVVNMARNNAPVIASQLAVTSPSGGTPTAPSLAAAREAAQVFASSGQPVVVVLATDGAPNCNEGNVNAACTCTDPDAVPGNCAPISCVDDVGTFAELGALRELGVKTFVLGVGVPTNAAPTIEQMALRSGAARDDDTSARAWFDATDSDSLRSSLEDIMERTLACRLATDEALEALDVNDIEVRVGDDVIARDPDRLDGWERAGANSIELYGPACDRAAAAVITVSTCE